MDSRPPLERLCEPSESPSEGSLSTKKMQIARSMAITAAASEQQPAKSQSLRDHFTAHT